MTHVELHNHTHYSILDGASTPKEYMARAAELGMSHLAITDHGTTAGHREFQRQAKAAGITPILGIEAYITTDRFDRTSAAKRQDGTGVYNHITLHAQNAVGLQNLEHMSKLAWTEGFFHKPRIDIGLLAEHSEGIIALSGCMSGMVAKSLIKEMPEQALKFAAQFKEILGERYFIEVMESNEEWLNRALIAIADELDIKPVITSDCHMANRSDLPLAESMLILNTNPRKNANLDYTKSAKMGMLEALDYLYPERKMSFTEFELWLHTYDEHKANLAKHGIGPEAIDNTNLIADMIETYPYFESLDTLPEVASEPMNELRAKVYAGLKKRGLEGPEVIDKVESELAVIEAKNLANYFLIELDVCEYADDNDILRGYGRGSAVSYLTNYALGITKINPIPYNLLPERFLSLDREDPADIDTDFAIDGRYKVKDYVQRKYGNVSNIANVVYYKDKSALKAAAKVFKAPFGETQKLLNRVTSIDEFEVHPDTKEYRLKYPLVAVLARKLLGRIQSFGMHAGGTIISKNPIEDYVPVQTANDPGDEAAGRVVVAALDMRELAEIGFVKYDFLGLRTLSIVDDAIKMIKDRHGVDIDIEDIPLDDKNLYDMISAGYVSGLFQTDTGPGIKAIFDMQGISNFAELVASNALVRPGASNSSVGETYITGKTTGYIKPVHPAIDPVLEETYGAVLYQEQQLQLCEFIAGMSKGDANKVRKAISKKIPEDLALWKDEFIAGATNTLGQSKAEAVWKDLEASADYAFAKAHAVGYSMLTLLTAYLKYYYPIEFLTANLNRMKSASKTDRMKTLKYLLEARRLGIRVKLPHVNNSDTGYIIGNDDQGDFILMGLSQIKYISDKTAQPLIEYRPYNHINDLKELAKPGKGLGVTKRTLEALYRVGASVLPGNPSSGEEKEHYFTYLNLPSLDTSDVPPVIFSQFRPLIDFSDDETFVCMGIVGADKSKPGWRLIDLVDESGTASVFVNPDDHIEVGRVYVFLVANNSVVKCIDVDELDTQGTFQRFLSKVTLNIDEEKFVVLNFKSRKTKAGKYMADITFADRNKELITALVWPSTFPMAYSNAPEGSVVEATFKELDGGGFAVTSINGKS
jgi:DNA polymerase-3 subunit alpha